MGHFQQSGQYLPFALVDPSILCFLIDSQKAKRQCQAQVSPLSLFP